MIPTNPTYAMIYTAIYALMCTVICLRVMFFDSRDGRYQALPAWLSWVICVATASVPIRFLFGTILVPDLASVIITAFLLCAVWSDGGSIYHLLRSKKHYRTTDRRQP
ncbi:phage holin family protein [Aeromonas rivipollensis]|uniref:phage holin family protein n=1 Tax=Aeromonas rivipollensis TaxID=948519 RepID=UPI003D22C1F2